METSILTSTKKILGLGSDYTAFDLDVITHINTALSTLTQLGIGPTAGLSVEDDSSDWSDFLDPADPNANIAKSYVYLRVRLIFDPPQSSYTLTAFQQQLTELEERMSINRENVAWVNPDPPSTPSDTVPWVTWGEVVYD